MGYKLDLLQPKKEVFWHLLYSRSETSNAWKIPLEVMKSVYLHPTYVLSVLIIGLNITCTKFCILWICTRPTFYLYTLSTQKMTRAKWWNTCIASQHLGTFIKAFRDEEKPSQERLWIWHPAAWASFIIVPTFVTRRLHICKAARDPSGDRWNYLSRRLSSNFAINDRFNFI